MLRLHSSRARLAGAPGIYAKHVNATDPLHPDSRVRCRLTAAGMAASDDPVPPSHTLQRRSSIAQRSSVGRIIDTLHERITEPSQIQGGRDLTYRWNKPFPVVSQRCSGTHLSYICCTLFVPLQATCSTFLGCTCLQCTPRHCSELGTATLPEASHEPYSSVSDRVLFHVMHFFGRAAANRGLLHRVLQICGMKLPLRKRWHPKRNLACVEEDCAPPQSFLSWIFRIWCTIRSV